MWVFQKNRYGIASSGGRLERVSAFDTAVNRRGLNHRWMVRPARARGAYRCG
jgi:hypothetical protein